MSDKILELLQDRAGVAMLELSTLADASCADQRHLDGGSNEQAYWRHGYQSAVLDLFLLVSKGDPLHRRRFS